MASTISNFKNKQICKVISCEYYVIHQYIQHYYLQVYYKYLTCIISLMRSSIELYLQSACLIQTHSSKYNIRSDNVSCTSYCL